MSALGSYPLVSPFLWFQKEAEQAVDLYVSVFPNSSKLSILRMPPNERAPEGMVLTVGFELDGQKMTAMNGSPGFKFNESTSFVVRCGTQEEIDAYWTKLTSDGGQEGQCGWLKDRFGLSWQIIPTELPELIRHPGAMAAMMGMKKMVIAELKAGAESAK